jgi:hypothetical protein
MGIIIQSTTRNQIKIRHFLLLKYLFIDDNTFLKIHHDWEVCQ